MGRASPSFLGDAKETSGRFGWVWIFPCRKILTHFRNRRYRPSTAVRTPHPGAVVCSILRTYRNRDGLMKSTSRRLFVRRQDALALLLGVFGLLFLFQNPARAQAGAGTGRIEGTVTDSSGAVVPGVQVTAREETTNITASVTSEDDGHFVFLYLAPGSYDIF